MTTAVLLMEVEAPQNPPGFINKFLHFEDVDGTRMVFGGGQLLYHYVIADHTDRAFVIGSLARAGLARIRELAVAFGLDPKTVYVYRTRIEAEGAQGVLERKRGPKGASKLGRALRGRVLQLKEQGLSDRAVARQLGIDHRSVARILREADYRPPEAPSLPGVGPEVIVADPAAPTAGVPETAAGGEAVVESVPAASGPDPENAVLVPAAVPGGAGNAEEEGSDESSPVVASSDVVEDEEVEVPATTGEENIFALRPVAEAIQPRLTERALAAGGGLAEADPILVPGRNLRGLGLLLALPGLLEVGVLTAARKVYRALKPGFYGLTSTILTLLFMALFRIKRPEAIKGQPPEILGRVLGLDRSPEVKTIRRKLGELAGRQQGHELLGEIARTMCKEHEDLLGFLYVDGHVRAYHGKWKIPKTWVPCRRLCLPATTDYWVNDAEGAPFFFLSTEGNPSLSKALPGLLAEVKELLGERRATVIFDRGGWSQKALQKIVLLGFDFITYRRRPYDDLPAGSFTRFELAEGVFELAEGEVEYGILGTVRLVAKRDPDGRQVHIVTNLTKEQLGTAEVYLRMVHRWGQENFFKYMRQEYALDALVSYELVPADGERLVPNPAWKERDKMVRQQRQEIEKLEQQLGAGSREPAQGNRPTIRGFKAACIDTGGLLAEAERKLARLVELRGDVSKRIPLKDALKEPPLRLEYEKKVLTDIMKIAAYRAETALVNAITPDYPRAGDEARKLIQEALHASGDLEVDADTVTIRLEPLSSPHRTRALEKLCTILSDINAVYPGTALRLRYEVRTAANRAE